MAALAAWQSTAIGTGAGAPARGEEGLFFSCDGVLGFEGEACPAALAGVEGVVIDTLRDEYGVGKAEVDADCNSGGSEVGCESPCRENWVVSLEERFIASHEVKITAFKLKSELRLERQGKKGNIESRIESHTCQVRQIAQEPDEQEAHRQAIGGFGFVVGDKLGKLHTSVRMAREL